MIKMIKLIWKYCDKKRFSVFLKKIFIITGVLICSIMLAVCVGAEADYRSFEIISESFYSKELLCDGNERTYSQANNGASFTVTRDDGISSLYVVFDRIPGEWQITDIDSGKTVICGTNDFLHEFADINGFFGYTPKSLRCDFPSGASIDEIYAFSSGELPDWVQVWEAPCDNADLLLISSHSDDEQLFFAGILPYYAGERGLEVQVVYLVSHFDTHERPHEQLDGLWTVGVKNYPIISDFPDLYSESFEGAISAFSNHGYTYDDFCEYITWSIRRFKPLVVVSHDINGEYGHGTHILCTSALRDSLNFASDSQCFPESAAEYGTWEVKKTYLHLYPENAIVLNFDEPLMAFNGKTAFEVTQEGFAHHKSQHWTWFYKWIYGTAEAPITKASQISTYSPCLYGIYKTTVGNDVIGGDFFENIKTYGEIAAEKAAEEERLAEESRRAESESLLEESRRLDAEKNSNEAESDFSPDDGSTDDKKADVELIFVCIFGVGIIMSFVVIALSREFSVRRK